MDSGKALGILVGGGPAPGINGVISAAAIEALNRGVTVYGIRKGFELISQGDISGVQKLTVDDVSRIHSEGGSYLLTSRANPTKSPEMLQNVVRSLKQLNIGYLVTIGGDDTATSAQAVARTAGGEISVGHVPKTIDNDLPLPEKAPTFGYQTAREVGTQITETLMIDARTTSRWYLVVAMGRKAGHLALGIGISAGATLTLIPEEFPNQIPLSLLVDIVAGAVIKRQAMGRPYGVVVLAEGLAEKLDPESIPELQDAERDPHGHIRYAELDIAGIVKRGVRNRLSELGYPKLTVVEKNVGYELRCYAPNSFDREYTRILGYGVVDFLLSGGSEAMISRQRDSIVPIPFSEIIDAETGKTKVRFVDTTSDVFRAAQKYMIKLAESDFQNDALMERLCAHSKLTGAQFKDELRAAAKFSKNGSDSIQRSPIEPR